MAVMTETEKVEEIVTRQALSVVDPILHGREQEIFKTAAAALKSDKGMAPQHALQLWTEVVAIHDLRESLKKNMRTLGKLRERSEKAEASNDARKSA